MRLAALARLKNVPKHVQYKSRINGDGWSTEVCVSSCWLRTRVFRHTRNKCNIQACVISRPLSHRNGEQLLCKSISSVAQRPACWTASIRGDDLRGGSVCYTMTEVCDQICIEWYVIWGRSPWASNPILSLNSNTATSLASPPSLSRGSLPST